MNFFNYLRSALSKTTQPQTMNTPKHQSDYDSEVYPDELGTLATILATPIAPRPQFVAALGQTLMSQALDPPNPTGAFSPPGFRWRKTVARAIAAAIVLSIVVILVLMAQMNS